MTEIYLQHPGDVVELRVLGAPGSNGFTRNFSGYFSEPDALKKAVDKFDKQSPQYCSVTINPVNPALLARAANKMRPLKKGDPTTSDADISVRRWIPIDIDPVRPAGISSTDDEKKAAEDIAFQIMSDLAAEWGEPVHADSGNGIHLLYPINLPNDASADVLLKNCLRALSLKYSNERAKVDTDLANASRILKFYGTTARKGDSTPDRPHRKSKIVSMPESCTTPVSVESLHRLAATLPISPTSDRRKTSTATVDRARAYLESVEPAIAGQNGDRATFRVACVLANDFGLSDTDALQLMGEWNARCDPPWSDRELEEKIKHARLYAKKPASELADQQLTTTQRAVSGAARGSESSTNTDLSPREIFNKIKNTDQGNAERLVEGCAGLIKHAKALGWYAWKGNHWAPDETAVRQLYVDSVVNQTYSELQEIDPTDKDSFKALHRHAKKAEAASSVGNCLQMASSMRGVNFTPGELDSDPMLFAANNKTIDLKTMTARDHDPKDMITRHSQVDYDENARCPMWMDFLKNIFNHDQSLAEFVQMAVGYSLTGSTKEQCLFLLYGTGRNGKSVFMNILAQLMGGYSMETPPHVLMRGHDKGDRPTNDIARLVGARLASTNETEEGEFLAESKVKAMTGDDKIIARFLHKEFFEFWPKFKIWVRTNHKPRIKGSDDGIWRRIRLIPFTVQVPEHEIDVDLGEKLRSELPGILNWALEGCLLWSQCGLQSPPAVIEATSEYRTSQDLLGSFITERCIACPIKQSGSVEVGQLYEAYRDWCEDAGERAVSKRNLSFRLSERGYSRRRGSGGVRMWDGIRLDTGQDSEDYSAPATRHAYGEQT